MGFSQIGAESEWRTANTNSMKSAAAAALVSNSSSPTPNKSRRPVVMAGLSAQEYADLKRGGGIPPTVLTNTGKTLTPEAAEMKRRAAVSFSQVSRL